MQEFDKLVPRHIVDNHILLGLIKRWNENLSLDNIKHSLLFTNYKKMNYLTNSYVNTLRKDLIKVKPLNRRVTFSDFMSQILANFQFAIHVKGIAYQFVISNGMLLDIDNDKLLIALTHFVEPNGDINLKTNGKSYKIWINKDLYDDDKFPYYKSIRRNVNKAKDDIRNDIQQSRIISLKDNETMAKFIEPVRFNYAKHNITDIISDISSDIKIYNELDDTNNLKILEKCKDLVL